MTLRKYVIVYFILLNLVIVIAQKSNTLSPSSEIPSSTGVSSPSSTPSSESDVQACLNGNACKTANETLKLCNGAIKPPSKYIEEGTRSGIYKPEEASLTKCMCNQPYYDTLSECIECFVNVTGAEFKVQPIEEYKDDCKKLGTTFTQTIPPPQTSGIPRRLRLGLIIGIVTIIVGLVGIGLLKYYRRKRRTQQQSLFAKKISTELHESGNRLSTGDSLTTKYPPPKSPSTHYPPPTSQSYEYPPPSNISNIPTPQSTTPYYPPPGGEYPPPHQPPRGGQGGQSDSYYEGNF